MLPAPPIRGIYRTDPRARAAYAEGAGIYRILPAAVCLPADPEDLVALVRWAAEHHVSLIPRGAGSGMGGGNVGDGVVVDLTGLPRLLEIDPDQRTARTSANVTLAELNAAAAPYGLRLPPDPSSGRWATLGGMVSTNAAGARSVRYGSVRSWVDQITMVTGPGMWGTFARHGHPIADRSTATGARGRGEGGALPEDCVLVRREGTAFTPAPGLDAALRSAADLIATRFPRVRKNSSGYALDAYLASGDVLDLIVGAEGTLGIVTEMRWRLDPIPPHRAGLRVSLRSLDALSDLVLALHPVEPSAVELLDRTFLELVAESTRTAAIDRSGSTEAMVLVEIERPDPNALQEAIEAAVRAARPIGSAVEAAYSAEGAEKIWALRHAASPILAGLPEDRRSLQVIEDACVPVEHMGDYIRTVRHAAAARDLTVVLFGHAGDGHVHVNLLPELARPGWETAVASLLEEVTDAVIRLGGTPSGEHGDGRLRARFLERVYGAEIVALFRQVKQTFDPLGIFNPGIILPSGEPPIARLKAGTGAVPLPVDIARALRRIEREGGYGQRRLALADTETV